MNVSVLEISTSNHIFGNSLFVESLLEIVTRFKINESKKWYKKYMSIISLTILTIIEVSLINANFTFTQDELNDKYDKMVVSVDLGDFVTKPKTGAHVIEIDDVFGNEYIKKKDEVIDSIQSEDPRIAGAVNPVIGNATRPIDMTPQIKPLYTKEARAAGIEGTVVLELIVADDGKVLRAKPVGKKIGFGLEKVASSTFMKKTFKPSLKEGKPITVKFYQPVKFILI